MDKQDEDKCPFCGGNTFEGTCANECPVGWRLRAEKAEAELSFLKSGAEWRHRWHRWLGRHTAEAEGSFYKRISKTLADARGFPQEEGPDDIPILRPNTP